MIILIFTHWILLFVFDVILTTYRIKINKSLLAVVFC